MCVAQLAKMPLAYARQNPIASPIPPIRSANNPSLRPKPGQIVRHLIRTYHLISTVSLVALERLSFERNHSNDKKSLKIKILEQDLIEKIYQLFWSLL
jgi:hypothetical protein